MLSCHSIVFLSLGESAVLISEHQTVYALEFQSLQLCHSVVSCTQLVSNQLSAEYSAGFKPAECMTQPSDRVEVTEIPTHTQSGVH